LGVLRFFRLDVGPNPPYNVYANSNGSGVFVTTDPAAQATSPTPPATPAASPAADQPETPSTSVPAESNNEPPASVSGTSFFVPVILDNAYGGWSTGVTIQNVSGQSTSISINYVDLTGRSVATEQHQLAGHGYLSLYHGTRFGSGFAGAALIVSEQPLAITANEVSNSGQAMSYQGTSEAARTLYAPVMLNNAFGGWTTGIGVLNCSSSPAEVTIDYYGEDGQLVKTNSQTLSPRGSWAEYQGGIGLPDGFSGSAIISANQPVTAIVNEVAAGKDAMSYNAATAGAKTQYLPEIYDNGKDKWTTGVGVQNPTEAEASVSIDYYSEAGELVATDSQVLPAHGYWAVYQGGRLGSGFHGSAVVSSSEPVIALVNEVSPKGGSMNYAAVSVASTSIQLPAVLNNAYGGWSTKVDVQNPSATPANVTLNYFDSAGELVKQQSKVLGANQTWALDQRSCGLPAGFAGSATISSDQPVAAVVGELSHSGSAMSYNATIQ
jgi:hypothetical protein